MNSSSVCQQQVQPLVNFTRAINTGSMSSQRRKEKVVFVMGVTGVVNSRLSIDLAARFPAEILNSDKMQVYKGLDILTNKVTEEERRGVPHHLLGVVDPNADYTETDFRKYANLATKTIIKREKLPIIAGGSYSFIESLVNDDTGFASRYECCFIWIDVTPPVLQQVVSKRVDQMVNAGLVEEVHGLFNYQFSDYTRGIRSAIGVLEMDKLFRAQGNPNADPKTLDSLLQAAVFQIKENTCKLACSQVQKIHLLRRFWGQKLHRIDATDAILHQGEEANEAWQRLVVDPSATIITQFLQKTAPTIAITKSQGQPIVPRNVSPLAATRTATR